MANTLRIKRSTATAAPASLLNAEIAYSEASDRLFIGVGTGGAGGSATSIVAIGGKGSFVDLLTGQSIDGTKTFLTSPIVPTPTAAGHAVTKAYVDGITPSIAAGSGISTSVAGTTVTVSADSTIARLAGATFTGLVGTVASATGGAGFRLPHGAAPSTPVDGDVWSTTGGLFLRQNGTTQQYVSLGETQTISGNKTFSNASNTFGSSTATGTTNLASGATISGSTKTVNLGTGGVAGSTTNIAIGSTTGTSTTTLQGTTNGVTLAADTNSTGLATTAFVVGQAGSATPLVNGTAAVGTSFRYARQDHVHPTDTSRAPIASPAFSGVPTVPTAAAGTNTTQAASTAFVQTAVANLVASAPAALDTLNELAAALGGDANFATTVSTSLGERLVRASNLSDLTNVATARTNLGLGSMALQASSNVNITGGAIDSITIDGGTF